MKYVDLETGEMFPDLNTHPSWLECLQQLQSLPPGDQTIINRVWDSVEDYYAKNRRATGLTRDPQLRLLLSERYTDRPQSLTAWDRAHHKVPVLAPWPIRRNMRRPWLPPDDDVIDIPRKPEDQIAAGQYQLEHPIAVVNTSTGERKLLCELAVNDSGIIRGRFLVMAAAAASGLILLDGMDGKVDHVVHWCRVLAGAVGLHV